MISTMTALPDPKVASSSGIAAPLPASDVAVFGPAPGSFSDAVTAAMSPASPPAQPAKAGQDLRRSPLNPGGAAVAMPMPVPASTPMLTAVRVAPVAIPDKPALSLPVASGSAPTSVAATPTPAPAVTPIAASATPAAAPPNPTAALSLPRAMPMPTALTIVPKVRDSREIGVNNDEKSLENTVDSPSPPTILALVGSENIVVRAAIPSITTVAPAEIPASAAPNASENSGTTPIPSSSAAQIEPLRPEMAEQIGGPASLRTKTASPNMASAHNLPASTPADEPAPATASAAIAVPVPVTAPASPLQLAATPPTRRGQVGPVATEALANPSTTPTIGPLGIQPSEAKAPTPSPPGAVAGRTVARTAGKPTTSAAGESDGDTLAQVTDASSATPVPSPQLLPVAAAPLPAAAPTAGTAAATPAVAIASSVTSPLRPSPPVAAPVAAADGEKEAFAVAVDPPALPAPRAEGVSAAADAPAASSVRKPAMIAGRLPDEPGAGGNPSLQLTSVAPAAPSSRPVEGAAIAPVTVVTTPPGLAHDIGLAIARQVSADGNQLHIRLEPAELGRIDVRMSFDGQGNLRAVVGADSPVALDLLRRDSADLNRAIADAGIQSDSQSFRFESRSDGRGSDSGTPRPTPQRVAAQETEIVPETPDPAQFRPLRWRGQIDIMA